MENKSGFFLFIKISTFFERKYVFVIFTVHYFVQETARDELLPRMLYYVYPPHEIRC